MNGRHLLAFLWLRWRLRANQLKRAGTLNAVITGVFAAAAIPGAVIIFIGAILVGWLALPLAADEVGADDFAAILLLVWDGIALLFLLAWSIGLLSELQRSEALSINKFLHLPVSLSGVFLINYLSSLLSVNLLMFLPLMLGLVLGLALGVSARMLLLLPMLAAFLLAVTAPTYQFQGWLAALMVNPRRRRTIIVVLTMSIILLSQLPNLINLLRPWGQNRDTEIRQEEAADRQKLEEARSKGEITQDDFGRQMDELAKQHQERRKERDHDEWEQVKWWAHILSIALPPGWLGLGVWGAAVGDLLPALLGTIGFTVIGTVCLWRAYHTTIRLYTGQYDSGARKVAAVAKPVPTAPTAPTGTRLLERNLPGVSERASAIALASFRALIRAPEVKMILLTPIILMVVFGAIFLGNGVTPPEQVRPFMPFAGMALTLVTMMQLVGNQFGFDRSGFRVYVLSPAPRREVLLGKNMAAAPIALGLGAAMALIVEVIYPMRIDVFLAVLVAFVSLYLLYCGIANWLSILVPVAVAAGTGKPIEYKIGPILIHLSFIFMFPLMIAPVLLPFGIQLLVDHLWAVPGLPIALALAALECVAIVFLYRAVLGWQGRVLQMREQKILEVVTTKAE